MSEPVTAIRNVGPAMQKAFACAGITLAEEVRELGADAAYRQLIAFGTRPHFTGYYALLMGLQGHPWNDCQGAEKEKLRKRFDELQRGIALKTGHIPGHLATAPNALGVRGRD